MRLAPGGAVLACALIARASRHGRLGDELPTGLHPRPLPGRLAQPRRPPDAGAALETVFTSDQPVVWSVVRSARRHALRRHRPPRARLPHRPRRQERPRCGPPSSPRSSPWPWTRKGALYAATRRTARSTASRTARPRSTSRPGTQVHLVAGVGAGRRAVRRHRRSGQDLPRHRPRARARCTTRPAQSHVTSLALDAQGRLLAAPSRTAFSTAFTAKDKAFVLYDANLPEIRAIVPAPDGAIYAAALGGGSAARRRAGRRRARRVRRRAGDGDRHHASITVERDGAGRRRTSSRSAAARHKPAQTGAAGAARHARWSIMSGVEKSAVYRINPDNTVETLWTSKEENVYDLLRAGADLIFSTDAQGRIYGVCAGPQGDAAGADQRRRGHARCRRHGRLAAGGHRQHGDRIYRLRGRAAARRRLRIARARRRHGGALGQPELARTAPGGPRARSKRAPAIRRGRTRPGATGPAPLTDPEARHGREPQRALHPVAREFAGAAGATPDWSTASPWRTCRRTRRRVVKSINVTTQGPARRRRPGAAAAQRRSGRLQHHGDRYRRGRRRRPPPARRRRPLARALRPAVPDHLAGRGPRRRPPGLRRVFPRRGRARVEAAEGQSRRNQLSRSTPMRSPTASTSSA